MNVRKVREPLYETVKKKNIEFFHGRIITIHVGQAGINIARPFWEMISFNCGVDLLSNNLIEGKKFDTDYYFYEKGGKWYPSAIIIDNDPFIIDEFNLLHFKECFEFTFALNKVGTLNYASYLKDKGSNSNDYNNFIDKIKTHNEFLDGVKEVHIIHHSGGASGSGIASRIAKEFKLSIVNYFIYPDSNLYNTMEIFNSCLSLRSLKDIEKNKLILISNQGISETIQDSEFITYNEINEIISKIPFPGIADFKIAEGGKDIFTSCVRDDSNNTSIEDSRNLKHHYFHNKEKTFKIDYSHLHMRGKNSNPYLFDIEKIKKYPDLQHDKYICEFSFSSKVQIKDEIVNLTSHSGIGEIFSTLKQQFKISQNSKSHKHKYLSEGIEELDLVEAEKYLEELTSYYKNRF